MTLEKVPKSLKGALSRWLIEPRTGVFVGNPSERVRDQLWERAVRKCKDGRVTQMWTALTPQGFAYREHNGGSRRIVEFEGMALVQIADRQDLSTTEPEPGGIDLSDTTLG